MWLDTNSTILTVADSVVDGSFSTPADRDLQRRITTFLSTQHRAALRSLEVEANHGVVILRGRVATFYEKQLSAQLARRVAGVLRLIDEVVVNRKRGHQQRHEVAADRAILRRHQSRQF